MGKYRTNQETGDQSEYEDEDTIYRPKKELGKGTHALAREFHTLAGDRSVVILSPREKLFDEMELKAKLNFFKASYPKEQIHLYKKSDATSDTYRLVLPLVPGTPYGKLKLTCNPQQHIDIFLSAVLALESSHSKGYAIIDLHGWNILYDEALKMSYFIDGGYSAKIGTPIHAIYKLADEAAIKLARKKYRQAAPECFSASSTLAAEQMDIFSLGFMMQSLLKQHFPTPEFYLLCIACQHQQPELRPALAFLKEQLYARKEELRREKLSLPIKPNSFKAESIKEFILNQLIHHPQGVKPINDWESKDAKMLILEAVIAHSPELINRLLLDANQYGWNLLMLVLRFHQDLAPNLFDKINLLEPSQKKIIFKQTNVDGWNPLMIACRHCPLAIERIHILIAPLGQKFVEYLCQQTTLSECYNALTILACSNFLLIEPLIEIIRELSISAQLNIYFHKRQDNLTHFEFILQHHSLAIPSLLKHLHHLYMLNPKTIKSTLQLIPLRLLRNVEHLMLFLKLFGDLRRKLTSEEHSDLLARLLPQHWYQISLQGWFKDYIAQDKVYQHILCLNSTEQQEILALLEGGISPLKQALEKKPSWLGFYSPNYAAILMVQLSQKFADNEQAPPLDSSGKRVR